MRLLNDEYIQTICYLHWSCSIKCSTQSYKYFWMIFTLGEQTNLTTSKKKQFLTSFSIQCSIDIDNIFHDSVGRIEYMSHNNDVYFILGLLTLCKLFKSIKNVSTLTQNNKRTISLLCRYAISRMFFNK
jgi:hypothetical protein